MDSMTLDYGYRTLYGALLLAAGLGIFARIMYVRTRLMLAGKADTTSSGCGVDHVIKSLLVAR